MDQTRGIIVAVSPEGVIGLGGKIPWHYGGDLRRFKRVTLGKVIVMGRVTWESIGSKPLPDRRNLVITRQSLPGVECFTTVPAALATCNEPLWFIGGARIYAEAMDHADLLDVTYVPNSVDGPEAARFPPIDPTRWISGPLLEHEDEPTLTRRVYTRRTG